MAIISLKRYLSRNEDEAAYMKVISLLLNGIAQHSSSASGAEMAAFRDEMQTLQDTVDGERDIEHLLVVARAAIQTLDSYSDRATRFSLRQGHEMQTMISMLAQTVISISGGSERSNEGLQRIKREMQQAHAVDDVHDLKLRLGECLKTVYAEASRQKTETDGALALAELQCDVRNAQKCVDAQPGRDPVTELPLAPAANLAFAEALTTPGRKYVVMMVVDRLQLINARFGNAAGDQMLTALRKYIESNVIAQTDHLFRWSGPTLVALIARPEGIEYVRGALKRLLDRKLDHEFDIGGRTALISLSVAWSVIALIPPASNLASIIDGFVASQRPRDYC